MKRTLLSILTAAAFTASSFAQGPAVSPLVSYQAYLTDNSNEAYGKVAPTNYDAKFQLYTATTGGTAVWAEQQTVTISAGQLSVLLGNGTQVGTISHAGLDVIFGPTSPVVANSSLYLGITVNVVGATTATEFLPRQQIISNPLSLRAKFADTAQTVATGGITSTAFAIGSVNAAAILDSSILAGDLADSSVTSAKIFDGTILAGDIADGSVTSSKILDSTILTGDIAVDTILAGDIAAGAVATSEILDGTIGTLDLADNAVTTAKIAADTIGADDINVGAVATSEILDGTIGILDMADNAIGSAELVSDFLSLSKVSGGRLSIATAASPLVIDTASNGSNWDIRLGASGMRHTNDGFFDISNSVVGDLGYNGAFARLSSAGTWSAVSDRRMKRDIAPLHGLLDKALALEPVTYHYKSDTDADALQIGFIAQEVQAVVPSLVTEGDILTLNYSGMSTIAIGAIQEQHAIVKGQDRRIESLEKENADLKGRLERLEQALGNIK